MPTYDYICKSCNHTFELFQSMKDAPKRKCPECGKNALERLIGTGAAIMFKGSGFYETDYRSESYKKAAEADKPSSSTDKSDTAGKDASKPAETKASDSKSTESNPSKDKPASKSESKPANNASDSKKPES